MHMSKNKIHDLIMIILETLWSHVQFFILPNNILTGGEKLCACQPDPGFPIDTVLMIGWFDTGLFILGALY